MKAKLIKDNDGYWLDISDDGITKRPLTDFGQLSIKNCEAIENGYDLDELAEEWCMKPENNWSNNNNEVGDNYGSYKEGFQKALEILGDKKFTKNDILIAMICMQGQEVFYEKTFEETQETRKLYIENYIKSLQRAEWDVEIELICPHPSDTYVCGMQYGCDGDGCNHPEQIPYLDSDGCLILRRI